jgi:hypothetical protein
VGCGDDTPSGSGATADPCEEFCDYADRCSSKGGDRCRTTCEGWRDRVSANCATLHDEYLTCYGSIECSSTACEDETQAYTECTGP